MTSAERPAAVELPQQFQWKRWDAALDWTFGRTHTRTDDCAGCCCGGPSRCDECGGREHQDGVEYFEDGGYENGHSRFCEGCGNAMGEWPVRAATS